MSLIPIGRHVGLASVAFFLLTLTSCNNKIFPVPQPAKASWKATIVFDETIPPETREGINKEFDRFIAKSNMSVVKFYEAADTTEADMIIRVKEFKPVSRGKQVEASIVSFVGIAVTPLAVMAATHGGFIVAFWYFPKSHSTAKMYVRDGENNSHLRKKTYFIGGPGFLKKVSTQKQQHAEGYRRYFKRVLKYYNAEILKAKRKGLATTP
jgi:hypothetical protein